MARISLIDMAEETASRSLRSFSVALLLWRGVGMTGAGDLFPGPLKAGASTLKKVQSR